MDPSRAAKVIALAATALVILATAAHGWSLAVDDAHHVPMSTVFSVERGEDYAAWTRVFAPRSHVSVFYAANDTPDRILLVRLAEVETLLRGDPVVPIQEFAVENALALGPHTLGRFDFTAPSPECPPPNGGCLDETMPTLVWLNGDGWRGASVSDATHYTVLTEAWDGPVVETERHEGPVRPDFTRTREGIVSSAPLWLGLAALGGIVGALAALAHVLLELRRRDGPPLVPSAPRTESTETMLMLARLTMLYVDAIRRSFLVSLVAILGITAAVLFFGLPPMLDRVSEQFRHMWELMELHVALFTLAPLYVMAIALAFWAVAFMRVRRELQEWRRRAGGFEEEAARILGA